MLLFALESPVNSINRVFFIRKTVKTFAKKEKTFYICLSKQNITLWKKLS